MPRAASPPLPPPSISEHLSSSTSWLSPAFFPQLVIYLAESLYRSCTCICLQQEQFLRRRWLLDGSGAAAGKWRLWQSCAGSFVFSLLGVCTSILCLYITEPLFLNLCYRDCPGQRIHFYTDTKSPLDEILAEGLKSISLFRKQTNKKVSFSFSAKAICSVSLSACQIHGPCCPPLVLSTVVAPAELRHLH